MSPLLPITTRISTSARSAPRPPSLTCQSVLPRRIALSPDEEHLYAIGNAADAVVAFRVCNPTTDGTDRVLPDQVVSTQKTELACDSLTAADYDVDAGGDVVFIAPDIRLENGFDVTGLFAAVNP